MKSNRLFIIIAIVIAMIVIVFPVSMVGFSITKTGTVTASSAAIIIQTIAWSLSIGLVSTCIGWPIGLRLSKVKPSLRVGIIAGLLMTLAIPAYAVFYAWWQLWPAGSWLHAYFVEHALVGFATKFCAGAALVGWSWPIPALISSMSGRSNNSLTFLQQLDGVSLRVRFIQRLLVDKYVILSSVLLVSAITAANTTCFDLAQISTIGNELRAVIGVGGSIIDVAPLSFAGVFIAIVASIVLLRFASGKNVQQQHQVQSCKPVIVTWLLLTGGPLALSALGSIGWGLHLWIHYGGDILTSCFIGLTVAAICLLVLATSSYLHLSSYRRTRIFATALDFAWVVIAFLPASLVSSMVANAWNQGGVEFVYRTPLILVIAHLTRVGFVASIAGKWVASSSNTRTLSMIDSTNGISAFLMAVKPRLIAATFVVVGVTLAMSLGEVALTAQLAPPSSHQPISVALLNAMHYQRPQMVTSALFFIIAVAAVGGIVVAISSRKFLLLLLLCFSFISCDTQEQTPIPAARIIGGAGLSDGKFATPRAIDANEKLIVVIDKSGRLQLFDTDGTFHSSWELELSGTGFPTGVSFDDKGNIWIADTHQNRVLVMDQEGNELLHFGSYGIGDGQFLYPTDIAFGENDEVFVSEYGGNDRVSVFDRRGNFLRSFGHIGSDDDGFKRPQSISIEPNTGNLFIADAGNHRIVVRDQGGNVLKTISSVGRSEGNLLYPYGLIFDSPNTFLVCEYGNNRLQRFNIEGESMGTLGGAGDETGLFKTPWAVAVTKKGLLVADTGNNRLQLLPYMMTSR